MNPKKIKPTAAQLQVLRNLAAGRSADYHCNTRSDYGGLRGTSASLYRRGWIADGQITAAGRAVLAAAS